jgi:chaperonin GroEL
MQYQKIKSVAKQMEPKNTVLSKKILATMKTVSDLVGATLGPGGCPVMIERQELNMPTMVTKDGVTVFRSLGFDDPVQHVLMEAARDASVRTANEAGDGTTTATILAEAIVRRTQEYCSTNPRVSPQKVVRRLERAFKEVIQPTVQACSIPANLADEAGRKILHSVAKISANGEVELADAVMQCFDIVGDAGNVTIMELSGQSHYEVEALDGFPIGVGYEDSCARYWAMFITDQGTQKCVMDNCLFILFHGKITDPQMVVMLLEKIGNAWNDKLIANHNVVIVANGFSDNVLALLGGNFQHPQTINVYPLVSPMSPLATGQLAFIEDVAAITGATIFDSLTKPLDSGDINDLGPGTCSFEASRFRSTIIGHTSEDLILDRVSTLEQQLTDAESVLERAILQERIGKITGGIAKLKVIGASNGELREKRDRAEDAVCAVRGAIKHGSLPGGGWMLLKLIDEIAKLNDPILDAVLSPALFEPVERLLRNCGLDDNECGAILLRVNGDMHNGKTTVYDALEQTFVDPVEGGVLDSMPAVLEAIRNSISIATLLGTLGGAIVFKRDKDLERIEAVETADFIRNSNVNPADERG